VLVAAVSLVAQQPPKFELADVHASTTPRWFALNYVQNNTGRVSDGRYVIRDASLLALIEAAYDVTDDMIAGGPSWVNLDVYDVIAKVPEGTTLATAKLMLQQLLADRFALVARRDTRPIPRFVLSVSKGGSKMRRAAESPDSGCRPQPTAMPNGPVTPAMMPNLKVACHNVTTTQIMENLRQMAGGPINTYLTRDLVDDTGLSGKYDFELEFTPIGIVGDKGPDGITLYNAVNKQLGLTLELKPVPVQGLVIESLNRNPTSNAATVKTDLALTTARFEVASIKPLAPGEFIGGSLAGSELRFVGNLRSLIVQAFMIYPNAASDTIIGLPASADSRVWVIKAKLPSTGEGAPLVSGARPVPPPRSVQMEMLRGLLADQFELKTHTENRETTVYAMTVSGKHKMTPGDPNERSDCPVDPTAVKPYPNMGTMVSCRNMAMSDFAMNLNQVTGMFDHPIVDATGLKGGWNFKLGFSRQVQGRQPANATGEAADPVGFSGYEAVERMMGVKLVKQKQSIPVTIVDHVAEKPLE
jgi:uncharacterized protein (TIGR03435 family)